jgi:hypothetical protein
MEVIAFIEDFALESSQIASLFRFILQIFHDAGNTLVVANPILINNLISLGVENEDDEGLLSADAILSWAEKRKKLSALHPKSKFVHDSKVQEFLEWLENEDDEEDEDDEDGENDSEEEEDED